MSEPEQAVVDFTPESVKEYLDNCIIFWRQFKNTSPVDYPIYYVDAFQSMRVSLFGEILPKEENENG